MLLPYSCDARLYHFPYATIGLIVVNVVVWLAAILGQINVVDGWLLEYGAGLQPIQWLLSPFMHLDLSHLLGNMFFLWAFGLVVEGKLGWARFLSCYLAIAVGESAIEQMLMANSTGGMIGSYGASAAVYGMMAMACIWAPANSLSVLFFLFLFPITFSAPVGLIAGLYFGYDILLSCLMGAWTSSILHLMGGLLGAVLGVVLLKRGLVECEGWDLLSTMSGGRESSTLKKPQQIDPPSPEAVASHQQGRTLEAHRRLTALLQTDQIPEALSLVRKMADLGLPLQLEREELLSLIVGLHKLEQWQQSAPLMAELVERFPKGSELVRLKLAQICLMELNRPAQAVEILGPLGPDSLTKKQEQLRRRLVSHASQLIADGVLECEEDPW